MLNIANKYWIALLNNKNASDSVNRTIKEPLAFFSGIAIIRVNRVELPVYFCNDLDTFIKYGTEPEN